MWVAALGVGSWLTSKEQQHSPPLLQTVWDWLPHWPAMSLLCHDAFQVVRLQICTLAFSFFHRQLRFSCSPRKYFTDGLLFFKTYNYQVKLFLISSLRVGSQNYVLYTEYDWIMDFTRTQNNLHEKSEPTQIKTGHKQLITKIIPMQLRHRPLPRAYITGQRK